MALSQTEWVKVCEQAVNEKRGGADMLPLFKGLLETSGKLLLKEDIQQQKNTVLEFAL